MTSVVFDATTLIIDSVTVNGQKITHRKNVRSLTMDLPSMLRRGEDVELVIHYANQSDDAALYIFAKEDAQVINVPYASGFTFSQPENARRWFPCNDQPDDKAYFTAHVRVPTGFTAISNGVPIDSVVDGDSASIQTWRHDEVMSTYLFAVNAAPYVLYMQEYMREDGTTVPIRNYHFDVDDEGSFYNARRAVRNVPEMFKAYEKYLGRYPYKTYGHVAVSPVPFGGMEHQTMSTVNRRWLVGDQELGYAHEVAHQWIGDEVTCATWADIWLNEGGATWGEALWAEHISGNPGYMNVLWAKRGQYMLVGLREPPVYDIPIGIIFNVNTTYYKSSWVYHMMRRMVGDSTFFPALRAYITRYAKSSAQTFEFMEFLEQSIPNPPVAWSTFFNQWLVKAGHPVYDAVIRPVPGGGAESYRVTISQTQFDVNVPEAFVMPLRVRILGPGTTRDTVVMISERTQSFDLQLGWVPRELVLDPDHDILCEKQSSVVSVDERLGAPGRIAVLGPHTAEQGQMLRVASYYDDVMPVRILAVTGEVVLSVSLPTGVSHIATSALPPGTYVLASADIRGDVRIPFIIVGR
jgi:aminopeptidase N